MQQAAAPSDALSRTAPLPSSAAALGSTHASSLARTHASSLGRAIAEARRETLIEKQGKVEPKDPNYVAKLTFHTVDEAGKNIEKKLRSREAQLKRATAELASVSSSLADYEAKLKETRGMLKRDRGDKARVQQLLAKVGADVMGLAHNAKANRGAAFKRTGEVFSELAVSGLEAEKGFSVRRGSTTTAAEAAERTRLLKARRSR